MVSTSCLPKKCYPRLKKDLGCLIINYTCTVQLTRIDLVVILSCLVLSCLVGNWGLCMHHACIMKYSLFAYVNSMRFFKIIFKLHIYAHERVSPNRGRWEKYIGHNEIRKLSYTYYDNASLVQYLGAVPSVISLIIQLCGLSISTTNWRQIDRPYEQCNLSIHFN